MVKELERRQKVKRALYSWLSLSVVAMATVFLIKGAAGVLIIERESADKVKILEGQSEVLTLRERGLEDEIRKLQTDEGRIEAIKEKFSATRAGEYVAIIVDERKEATSTEGRGGVWYKRWWDVIVSLYD